VEIGCNLAEYSKKGYGSKKAVLKMLMINRDCTGGLNWTDEGVSELEDC
jgi:hypothetical protein